VEDWFTVDMDQYSQPLSRTKTLLGELFDFPTRQAQKKPGRSLTVMWDERYPVVDGFMNSYSYLVRFAEPGSRAGNHYHRRKRELFFAAAGELVVVLEDLQTGAREEIELVSPQPRFLLVPTLIAHVIIARSENAILLVAADYPNTEDDEFPHHIC
jgi:oxalate decarboxylase/phosphoglucose isomerase-like protein (cupin superfamily)